MSEPYYPNTIKKIIFEFVLMAIKLYGQSDKIRTKSDRNTSPFITRYDEDNTLTIDGKGTTLTGISKNQICDISHQLNSKIGKTTTYSIDQIRNFINDKKPNFISVEIMGKDIRAFYYRYTITIPKNIFSFTTDEISKDSKERLRSYIEHDIEKLLDLVITKETKFEQSVDKDKTKNIHLIYGSDETGKEYFAEQYLLKNFSQNKRKIIKVQPNDNKTIFELLSDKKPQNSDKLDTTYLNRYFQEFKTEKYGLLITNIECLLNDDGKFKNDIDYQVLKYLSLPQKSTKSSEELNDYSTIILTAKLKLNFDNLRIHSYQFDGLSFEDWVNYLKKEKVELTDIDLKLLSIIYDIENGSFIALKHYTENIQNCQSLDKYLSDILLEYKTENRFQNQDDIEKYSQILQKLLELKFNPLKTNYKEDDFKFIFCAFQFYYDFKKYKEAWNILVEKPLSLDHELVTYARRFSFSNEIINTYERLGNDNKHEKEKLFSKGITYLCYYYSSQFITAIEKLKQLKSSIDELVKDKEENDQFNCEEYKNIYPYTLIILSLCYFYDAQTSQAKIILENLNKYSENFEQYIKKNNRESLKYTLDYCKVYYYINNAKIELELDNFMDSFDNCKKALEFNECISKFTTLKAKILSLQARSKSNLTQREKQELNIDENDFGEEDMNTAITLFKNSFDPHSETICYLFLAQIYRETNKQQQYDQSLNKYKEIQEDKKSPLMKALYLEILGDSCQDEDEKIKFYGDAIEEIYKGFRSDKVEVKLVAYKIYYKLALCYLKKWENNQNQESLRKAKTYIDSSRERSQNLDNQKFNEKLNNLENEINNIRQN